MLGWIIWAGIAALGLLVMLWLVWSNGYNYGYDQSRGAAARQWRGDWLQGYQEGQRSAVFGERVETTEASRGARWLN